MSSQDVSILSTSTSHRLPTVSASQALESLHARGSRAVSTGLTQLNHLLSPQCLPGHNVAGGLMRGKVTEIFGPSGVGKTAFGIQAAVSALRQGQRVVWADAACAPLVPQRFNDVLLGFRDPQSQQLSYPRDLGGDLLSPPELSLDDLQSHFHHYTSPTLAHLLALFMHPPASFPPPNTSLIVVDSLSTLFDNAYPRNSDHRTSRNKSDQARWAAGRKFAVMNELISTLTRVAAMHDIALLITSQPITKIRASSRAVLAPAISGAEWENGISTRLVLFRDWVPGRGKWIDADTEKVRKARFIGVVKAHGATLAEEGEVGKVVSFAVESTGLGDIDIAAVDIAVPTLCLPQGRPPKRHFTEIGIEDDGDPDSDELYGWAEDDEVGAEGLLIEDETMADYANAAVSRADVRTDRNPDEQQSKRMTPNHAL